MPTAPRLLARLRRLLAPLVLLGAAATAQAAPTLVVEGGLLIGANGVDVNGTLYDVRFIDGTCTAVFNGCDALPDFDFTDSSSALAAARALMEQVFIDVGTGQEFDTIPTLTRGCIPSTNGACAPATPYAPKFPQPRGDVMVPSAVALNFPVETADTVLVATSIAEFNVSNETWARWSLSPTSPALPEPGSWASAALALGLLALAQRRRRVR